VIPKNCLSQSLVPWHEQGGYLVLRKSSHWALPHVMHLGAAGRLSSYVPHAPLDHPVHALFGFEGETTEHDTAKARPMPLMGIVVGTWLMAIGATAWAIDRWWKQWRHQ
jgi:hypothetical protein